MSSIAPKYVNTRGREYECSICGDEVVDIKIRVMAHVYEAHLRVDQAPFYCTACQETVVTGKRLLLHAKTDSHLQRCTSIGMKSEEVLMVNSCPYQLQQPRDYVRFGKGISDRVFGNRARDSALSATVTHPQSSEPFQGLTITIPDKAVTDIQVPSPEILQAALHSANLSPIDVDARQYCEIIVDIRPQVLDLDFDDGSLSATLLGSIQNANVIPAPPEPTLPLLSNLLSATEKSNTLLEGLTAKVMEQTQATARMTAALERSNKSTRPTCSNDGDRERRYNHHSDRSRYSRPY